MKTNLLLVFASSFNQTNTKEDKLQALFSANSVRSRSKSVEKYIESSHKGTFVLIPSNIDIKLVLAKNPIKLKQCIYNINQQEDKVATILSLLVKAVARNMQMDASDIDDYVPFSTTILQDHVRDYNDYLQFLQDVGIIESDGYYIPDEKCCGYRFTEKYRYVLLKEYFIFDYKGNVKNGASVYKSFFKRTKEQRDAINKYNALYEDLCSVSMTDYSTVQEYIMNDLKEVALESVIKDFKKRRDGSWTEYKNGVESLMQTMASPRILGKQNSWISSLHALDQKHFYFKQDSTSQRLHTSVLGVKSECRKFLRLHGKEIISCDLKNSQPFISSLLFTEGPINHNISRILNKCLSNLKTENKQLNSSIFKRIKNYKSGNILPSTEQYLSLVRNGEIYEFLAIQLNKLKSESGRNFKEYDRADGKHHTFTLFFNPSSHESLARDIFRLHFPQVMSMFEDINILFTHTRRESIRKRIPYSTNTLAVLLQSIESHLILDVICKNMKEKYPEIPLLTVHDAIATNPEFKEPLEAEIYEVITDVIGAEPTIKIEEWI